MDNSGNLYFINNDQVMRVNRRMIETPYAGISNYVQQYYDEDGHPAVQTVLHNPSRLACDGVGNLYIAEYGDEANGVVRVRRVGTDGIIRTVAGGGTDEYDDGSQKPAVEVTYINPINDICADKDGNLFTLEWMGPIRKVSPSGISTVIADGNTINSWAPRCMCVDGRGGLFVISHVVEYNFPTYLYHIDGYGGVTTLSDAFAYVSDIASDSLGNLYYSDQDDYGGRVYKYSGSGADEVYVDLDAEGQPSGRVRGLAFDSANALHMTTQDEKVFRKSQGNTTGFQYVDIGDATLIKVNDNDGRTYEMTLSGRHMRTLDSVSGKELEAFEYDNQDRVIAVRHNGNENVKTHIAYNGTTVTITSPEGYVTVLTINGEQLQSVRYQDGGGYDFAYSPFGQLTQGDVNGREYSVTYDELSMVSSVRDERGNVFSFSSLWDNIPGHTMSYVSTLPTGESTTIQDSVSEGSSLPRRRDMVDASGLKTTISSSLDGLHELLETPDGMTQRTVRGIDSEFGTNPVIASTLTTPSGKQVEVTSQTTYDDVDPESGEVIETTSTTTLTPVSPYATRTGVVVNDREYDTANGLGMITTTSPEGRSARVFYDNERLVPTKISAPDVPDIDYVYDEYDRLSTASENGRSVTYSYADSPDHLGKLAQIDTADGATVLFDYDSYGRVTDTQVSKGGESHSLHSAYNVDGDPVSITTDGIRSHNFTYDAKHNVTAYISPMGAVHGYAYDGSGRLTTTTLPSGIQLRNVYEQGRLVALKTKTGPSEPEDTLVTMNYDSVTGHLASVQRGASEGMSFVYDGALPLSITQTGVLTATIETEYNAFLEPSKVRFPWHPALGGIDLAYDGDGLLTNVGEFSFARQSQTGRVESVSDSNTTVACSYTMDGDLYGIAASIGGAAGGYAWSVEYDALTKKITRRADTLNGQDVGLFDYAYDDFGRLTSVVRHGTGATLESYTYDSWGRRITGKNGETYTYNMDDQLIRSGAEGTAGHRDYTYSPDGWLAAKAVNDSTMATYEYLPTGELLQATQSQTGVTVEYAYDAGGRRVSRTKKDANGATLDVQRYLWAGKTSLLAIYDGEKPASEPLAHFDYIGGRLPVCMWQDAFESIPGYERYYLAYDQVGSLRAIFDDSGELIHRIDYDSWGNITYEWVKSSYESVLVPFGFAGGLYDRDTGLVLFGYRNYDPEIGRWTSKDPIGLSGGTADLYAYCGNDPINNVDPTGLFDSAYWGGFWQGFHESITDSLASLISGGRDGMGCVEQAALYGGQGLATATRVCLDVGTTAATMAGGMAVPGVIPAAGFNALAYTATTTQTGDDFSFSKMAFAGAAGGIGSGIGRGFGRAMLDDAVGPGVNADGYRTLMNWALPMAQQGPAKAFTAFSKFVYWSSEQGKQMMLAQDAEWERASKIR